jgi:hypothetical protein
VVEVDHNLTLARVPVTVGSTVIVHGQFEPDPGRPVIHYTHHPTGAHEGGWIQLNGHRHHDGVADADPPSTMPATPPNQPPRSTATVAPRLAATPPR